MTRALSVVIAAKDAADTLPAQLEALVSQHWPNGGEIIVADNGSNDGTVAAASRFTSAIVPVTIVDASAIEGAGHARNRGVEASTNPYIAFCDADDVVDGEWVRSLTSALDEAPAVGGRLDLTKLNPQWVVESRGQFHEADELPRFDGRFPVLSSCNLGIQREVFDSVGGFDESYLRGQDAELSLRLHKSGVPMHFARDAVVHYRMRSGLRSIYRQAHSWGAVQHRIRQTSPDSPTIDRMATLRSWSWLLAHPHYLATEAGRARLAYVAGIRVGTANARRASRTRQRR